MKLIKHVDAGHILLPNLLTLALQTPDRRTCRKISPYLWISVFSSPSLKSISIGEGVGRVSPRLGSGLSYLLANACPNLTALNIELLPEEQPFDQEDLPLPLHTWTTDYVPNLLQPNSALRHLSVNAYFVNKYATFIPRMNNLERLEIWYTPWHVPVPPEIPSEPFPALITLALCRFHPLNVELIWKRAPNPFAGVTTLQCIFSDDDEGDDNEEDEEDEGNQGDIVEEDDQEAGESEAGDVPGFSLRFATALSNTSPHITHLSLHLDPNIRSLDLCIVDMDANTLRMLGNLPLREFSVDMTHFERSEWKYSGAELCELLASTFPNVELLRWMSQRVNYQDLFAFADMFKLRHLGFRVNDVRTAVNKPVDPPMPRPSSPFCILEMDHEYDFGLGLPNKRSTSWFKFARRIATTWPNVQIIAKTQYLYFMRTDMRIYPVDNRSSSINRFIGLLRGKDLYDEELILKLWASVVPE
ncbi:hypothetical protein FS749_003322 [Ceratobasidium sp. UAMH 11750]|nr:hypothetical protein FS749_003322 [Ceratobasidium sp. UAMH 11750]